MRCVLGISLDPHNPAALPLGMSRRSWYGSIVGGQNKEHRYGKAEENQMLEV